MSWMNRQGFCFTGKGMLNGKLVSRDVLARVVRAQGGIHYETYSQQIDFLVASRMDTGKWAKAIEHGKRCLTYDVFWQQLGVTTHAELHELIEDEDWNAQRAGLLREREREEAAARVAVKREAHRRQAQALAEAETQIEGWGTF